MTIKKYFFAALANPSSVLWRLLNIFKRKFPFDYYFLNGWSLPPDMITILVTKRCNFKCSGCSSASPQYTREFKGNELSTEEIKSFIDQVARFHPSIYFNGGEPTLRTDLFDLIKHAKKRGLITAFTTNGSLLNDNVAASIVDSKLDFLSISWDGTPERHNTYRGFPDAYERLTAGITRVLNKRRELGSLHPHLRVTCIINPENIQDPLFVLRRAQELNVDEVAFGNLMFYPKSFENKQREVITKEGTGGPHMIGLPVEDGNLPFKINYPEMSSLYQQLKEESKIPLTFVPSEIDYEDFYSYKQLSDRSRCLSPWFIATLLPDGGITSCQEYVVGNIKDERFLTLWNNRKMRNFRLYRRKKVFPACFRCLEGQELVFN